MDTVLFTGLGSIGRRHLRLLRRRSEDFEVHAYRTTPPEERDDPDVTVHRSLTDALAADPDVAFVTNPTALHVETALECARAGCHLFVEKPLSHSMDGVDELLRASEDRDLVTYVGCVLRFHPVLRRVDELLNAGRLGPVYSFRAYSGSYLPDWRPDRDYRDSYSADPKLGGGVVLDLIHELDYAYWLFGDVAQCHGWVGNVSDLKIDTEDVAELALEMRSGAVGSVHLDYYRPTPKRTLEVTGRDGVLKADLRAGTLDVHTNGTTHTETFEFERDDLFAAQLDYFLSHVEAGTDCGNDLREAKEVLRIALEARGN